MKRTLQNRRGSVLMEFVLVIPIFIVLIAWSLGNAQQARAIIRLESYQRAALDSDAVRGSGNRRMKMYEDFTSGVAGAGVFERKHATLTSDLALTHSGSVGVKAGVVMHGTTAQGFIDGLDLVQSWLNAAATLMGGGSDHASVVRHVSTTKDFRDGREGLYCLARAEHWWGPSGARHAESKSLAGDKGNWDFQTGDTYPDHWSYDFPSRHTYNRAEGPRNNGTRKLYTRHKAWEDWSG